MNLIAKIVGYWIADAVLFLLFCLFVMTILAPVIAYESAADVRLTKAWPWRVAFWFSTTGCTINERCRKLYGPKGKGE